MSAALVAWLGSEPVADLILTRRGDIQLSYRESAVAVYGVGALSLSVALPVSGKPYRGDVAQAWCDGLLPEGETRSSLETLFGVRRGDTFGLLAAIGRDCAGAVTFLEPGDIPPTDFGTPKPLDDEQLAMSIDALPERPLGADIDPSVRVSLGGLQAKLLLARTFSGWARPLGGAPSTHIVKPEPTDAGLEGLVAAEAMVQRAAAMLGVHAAEVALEVWGQRQVLIVTRYDREVRPDGVVVRRHQEDGAQALGINPPTGPGKYQSLNPQAPTYGRLARVLRDHAADVDEEWRRLGESMTLNVAVGNTDAHVRNHSLLIESGVVRLAPLYDSSPAVLFASSRQLSLWVGGQALLPHVTRRHVINEIHSWGVPLLVAEDMVERLLAGLPGVLVRGAQDLDVSPDLLERTMVWVQRLADSVS